MSKDWQSQAHVKWECKFHVVIVPKYRKKLLYGKVRRKVGEILRDLCRQAEVVLVDAPCLGTGTFARHPDARWRVTLEALGLLERLQSELLRRAAAAVPPGGLLVYSTCSLEPEENRAQVKRFLAGQPDFERETTEAVPPDLLSPEGDLMVLPQQHGTDGAYAARLRRHP